MQEIAELHVISTVMSYDLQLLITVITIMTMIVTIAIATTITTMFINYSTIHYHFNYLSFLHYIVIHYSNYTNS